MPDSTSIQFGVVAAVALAASIALVAGAATPAAASHGDLGNLSVTLPEASDHRPGDQNPEGATIRYFFQGTDAFDEAGAPNGLTLDAISVESEAVDFSACGVGNIAAFGLDRGGNNSGTRIDQDLVQHLKSNDFREDGLYLRFYQEEDFGGDPVFMNPEDAIRAQQGAGSSDGPCYTMPEEPGWYQMTGYLNGTTPEGEYAEEDTTSHYFYICDCADESEARERLGPPPSSDGEAGDDSPEGTPDTATQTPDSRTATPNADTPTPESVTQTGTPDATSQTATPDASTPATEGDGGDSQADSAPERNGAQADQPGTPTPGDGPGFGVVAALLALLAATLLGRRT